MTEHDYDHRLVEAAGPLLTAREVCERLNISEEALSEALAARRVLGVKVDTAWCYPAIQFGDDGVLPGLAGVLRSIGKIEDWDALRLLMAPDSPADEQPLVLLSKGDPVWALSALLARRETWADRAFDPSDEVDRIRNSLDEDMEAELRADRRL